MVAEEVVVSLAGGAPWGFRLQGGAEHHRPLQVAKVRRRSKACRAGLKEDDELVSIDDQVCAELSHAQAMSLIDSHRTTLNLRVKRAASGLHSVALLCHSPSTPSSTRVASPLVTPLPSYRPSVLSPTGGPGCLTSPPNSEAYYGETDSDADTHTHTHRRQRRTPPHARSPGRHDNQQEASETSEMSGYESALDGGISLQRQWEGPAESELGEAQPGVLRREVVYQPTQTEWTTSFSPPSHTLSPPLHQAEMVGGTEGEGEVDSGFQEAGGCVGLSCPPLVSPERAKEAMMMGSRGQLVPMVGPQQSPLSDELSTTYKDKARQAKLHRGESVVEKQVKEARSKCRSIASLLTDAPDPHSKGVLMFKKRRQRAKKYTLTCFGRAEGETGGETEGDTGGEEEEGNSFPSGSEVDEEGFSGAYDPTWDSGYLDLLDRRSSACPSATPTDHSPGLENVTYQGSGLDISAYQSPGLDISAYQSPSLDNATYRSLGQNSSTYQSPEINNSTYQSPGLDGGSKNQPIRTNPAPNPSPMSPPDLNLTNGVPLGVSRANMVLSPPLQTPMPDTNMNTNPGPNPNPNMNTNPGGVLNRTARPFTPGLTPPRAPATPVCFRPPQPAPQTKPKPVSLVTKPTSAVSMVTIPAPCSAKGPEARRAVSSTSLYIPPRPNTSVLSPPPILSPPSVLSPASVPPPSPLFSPPPSLLSPPASLASPPFPLPSGNPTPFSPPTSVHAAPFSPPSAPFPPSSTPFSPSSAPPPHSLVYPSLPATSQPISPSSGHSQPFNSSYAPPFPPSSSPMYPSPLSPQQQQHPPPHIQVPTPPQLPRAQPPPPPTFNPYTKTTTPMMPANPASAAATAAPPLNSHSLASREQRISVPASRTGILQDARRRGNKKPMFSPAEVKTEVSPNPALLSLLQNLDVQPETGLGSLEPRGPGAGAEAGTESGPEEDWLRLGAEACNFMQAQRGPKPPPVAPKPHVQAPQVPQLGGKGGQLFARRQSRMDRYVVDRTPTVHSSPNRPREPSPSPSLPATWKYSSSIRAPPPINYNPLLSPSCPTQAQKPKVEEKRSGLKKGGKKGVIKAVDIMSHQPYQLNSSLFSYGGGAPQQASNQLQSGITGGAQGPRKTARVQEIKRFSTPPPSGPVLKVIAPRSATTLGEPLWRSDVISPPPSAAPAPYQPYQPHPQPTMTPYQPPSQGASSFLTPPPPPAPSAPLPQLPILSTNLASNPPPIPAPYVSPSAPLQANRQFKSAPDLSPLSPTSTRPSSTSTQPARVPRPRFSTSNLGLQPQVWRPGSNMY